MWWLWLLLLFCSPFQIGLKRVWRIMKAVNPMGLRVSVVLAIATNNLIGVLVSVLTEEREMFVWQMECHANLMDLEETAALVSACSNLVRNGENVNSNILQKECGLLYRYRSGNLILKSVN